MVLHSFDSLRPPPSKRAPHSALGQPTPHSQSKTKVTHFRPIPFDTDDVSPATTVDKFTPQRKPIPRRYSSLRAPPPPLDRKPSSNTINRQEPFVRGSQTVSISLGGSGATSPHRALPWATQPRTSHHSGQSSGGDLDLNKTSSSPDDSPTQPSSPSSTVANRTDTPADFCELTPGDSSSNWSINDLDRLPSSAPAPAPPVPSIPAHFRPYRPFRDMPTHAVFSSEPESGYDSADPNHPHIFPAHPMPIPSAHSHRYGAPVTPDGFEHEDEDEDHVGSLPGEAFGFGNNRSMHNMGAKIKADKMLGLDSNAKLCSLFMISGVGPTDAAKWVPADIALSSRMQPQPDSLGFYWRPELLGTAFSGVATEALEKAMTKGKKMKKDVWPLVMKPPVPGERKPHVPDAGPDGAEKLISQTIKYAHPRDVEVINTPLMPNTTSHYFSFTIPSHSSTASAARARLDSIQAIDHTSVTSLDQTATLNVKQRQDLQKQSTITFYGATLTVWTCADPDRARQLADIRAQLRKKNELDSVLRAPITEPLVERTGTKRSRHAPAWMPYRNASMTDIDNSDTETVRSGRTESLRRSPWQALTADPLNLRDISSGTKGRGMKGTVESSDVGIGPLKAGEGDTFWMPYSLTLVSRHPIFDTMTDYIRTSWSMYQKSAKRNLYQMCKVLNHPIPRPGEMYRLNIGRNSDGEEMTIETTFPGAVDFDKGLIKTDFQLWPLFQAVDIDGILTAIEIAMSKSGKVIFTSQYTDMLCLAVHTMRYMVELRGWTGMAIPVIHARDIALAHDDPGPYILGLPMECRYMLATPVDACVIDLDNNTLTLRAAPVGIVTPRIRREKVKQKILQALGQQYPIERSVPTELKIAFPNNRFRPFHRIFYDGEDRPHFLGERLKSPPWWKANGVMGVFDKIMIDKHKKPSFLQRLKKSGLIPGQGPVTLGEQDMQTTMRLRAMHYIETRDDLEVKVAKINGKLMELMQEGQRYKRQFLSFERQTDILAMEQLRLEAAYKKEHEEAERLTLLAKEQSKENEKLDIQLKATEDARSTAMRQLSDMHQSMQDLEREREAIMDIIESQISEAIENHAAEVAKLTAASSVTDGSPTSVMSSLAPESQHAMTPLSSRAQLPPISRGYRPGTTESAMSSNSKWTSKTDAISILGLARRGYPTTSGNGNGENLANRRESVDMAHAGRDEVGLRIAAIQAKLDLALNAIGRNRSDSFATVKQGMSVDTSEAEPAIPNDDEGGLGLVTNGEQAPPSSETIPGPHSTIATPAVDPDTVSSHANLNNKANPDSASVRSSTPPSTHTAVPLAAISRPSSRPSSRLRIRRKILSSDDASSDTSDASLPKLGHKRILHAKSLTSSSSTASEADMLVTPSGSAIIGSRTEAVISKVPNKIAEIGWRSRPRSSQGSNDSGESMMKGEVAIGNMEEEDAEARRRISSISTTTVTFGPL